MKIIFWIACSLLTVFTIYTSDKNGDAIKSNGMVFQSQDAGKNWQDISQGLSKDVTVQCFDIIDNSLLIGTEKGIFAKQNKNHWQKDPLMNENIQAFDKVGNTFYGISHQSGVFQLVPQISNWLAAYTTLPSKNIRFLHETNDNALIAGTEIGAFRSLDKGLTWSYIYKDVFVFDITEVNGNLIANTSDAPIVSSDNGATWKKIDQHSWIGDITKVNGSLMACAESGLIKSMDNGVTWQVAFDQFGPAYHLQKIGNRLILTSNGQPKQSSIVGPLAGSVSKMHYSDDDGKTWKSMDTHLAIDKPLKSIVQFGDYLFCSHSKGLSRSSDWGNTWEMVLPIDDKKVYEICIKDNKLYCYKVFEGC